MSFTADEEWLATSGAAEVILCRFARATGQWARSPSCSRPARRIRVSAPSSVTDAALLAAGYSDGMVMFGAACRCRRNSVGRPAGAPVSALAWRGDGKMLAFGAETEKAGLLPL